MKRLPLLLLLACACQANELPDAPKPKPIETKHATVHRFLDRQTWIESGIWAAVGSADMVQTCRGFAAGYHELWMPAQSCRNVVLLGVSAAVGTELVAYALHRTGHHKLELWPVRIGIGANVAGLITSKRNHNF